METLFRWLNGKKTYISAGLGVFSVIILMALGKLSIQEGVPMLLGFFAMMGLRNAI